MALRALLVCGAFVLREGQAACADGENTSLPLSTPDSIFSVLADGTVLDLRTNLMWMRCLVGQSLVGNQCSGTARLFDWGQALVAARNQSFAGHNDWRVPNVKELLSIAEDRCTGAGLNANLFPVSGAQAVWSSTPATVQFPGLLETSWAVQFAVNVERFPKNTLFPILLVRSVR